MPTSGPVVPRLALERGCIPGSRVAVPRAARATWLLSLLAVRHQPAGHSRVTAVYPKRRRCISDRRPAHYVDIDRPRDLAAPCVPRRYVARSGRGVVLTALGFCDIARALPRRPVIWAVGLSTRPAGLALRDERARRWVVQWTVAGKVSPAGALCRSPGDARICRRLARAIL